MMCWFQAMLSHVFIRIGSPSGEQRWSHTISNVNGNFSTTSPALPRPPRLGIDMLWPRRSVSEAPFAWLRAPGIGIRARCALVAVTAAWLPHSHTSANVWWTASLLLCGAANPALGTHLSHQSQAPAFHGATATQTVAIGWRYVGRPYVTMRLECVAANALGLHGKEGKTVSCHTFHDSGSHQLRGMVPYSTHTSEFLAVDRDPSCRVPADLSVCVSQRAAVLVIQTTSRCMLQQCAHVYFVAHIVTLFEACGVEKNGARNTWFRTQSH